MNLTKVYPYYYPTTSIFVDDDRDFLLNFSLQLDERLSYYLYDSPQKAQNYIYKQGVFHERKGLFNIQELGNVLVKNPIVTLSVMDIYKEIYNKQRFSEISVVVVDFAMPGMDGVEFCRRLENTAIKKILLTGRADERTAIDAFNEGVIDRFVRKSDAVVVETINRSILELQQTYFKESAELLQKALSAHAFKFLNDKDFSEYFHRVCKEHDIVEYYLLGNPKGFLLLDSAAKPFLLLALSSEAMKIHYEIALDEKAPSSLLDVLREGKQVPYFWQTDGYYQKTLEHWEQSLYPAETIEGKERYHCAFIENPPFKLQTDKIHSYKKHLEELDFIFEGQIH